MNLTHEKLMRLHNISIDLMSEINQTFSRLFENILGVDVLLFQGRVLNYSLHL